MKAIVVVHEDGSTGVPGCEETAPGMFGPTGSADVEVDIVRPNANPEHGGEVTNGIALVSMQYKLRQGGRARSEIEQKWITSAGISVWNEVGGLVVSALIGYPPFFFSADHYPSIVAWQTRKLLGQARQGNHMPCFTAFETVAQIVHGKLSCGGNDDGAQLERCEHDFPNHHHVGKLNDDTVSAANAVLAQEIRNLAGAP